MIHYIMEVFLGNLEKLEWMDDVTKEKALEKVGTIIISRNLRRAASATIGGSACGFSYHNEKRLTVFK